MDKIRSYFWLSITLIAGAARTVNTPIRENGWNGLVAETVANAGRYALIYSGDVEVVMAGASVGTLVYITGTGATITGALTLTATSNTIWGRVREIPNPGVNEIPAGSAIVNILQPLV